MHPKERGPILAVEYDWGAVAAYTYRLVEHLSGARRGRVPPGVLRKDAIGDGDVGCLSIPAESEHSVRLGHGDLSWDGVASC